MMALFLYHFGKKPVITNEKRKGAYVHINVMKKQEEKQSVKPPRMSFISGNGLS